MTFQGTTAPGFRLQNENGEWITLSDLTAKGPVMVVFYPGDFTPVCTSQLCAYQESLERFTSYGIQIVGISKNTPEEHKKFRAKHGFEFPLLSDPGREVTKKYGVTSLFMLGGTSRAVFIVGRSGKILYRHVEATSLTRRKPGELLQMLGELKAGNQL